MNNKQKDEILITFSDWLLKFSVASFIFSMFQNQKSYSGIIFGIATLLFCISIRVWRVKDDNNR